MLPFWLRFWDQYLLLLKHKILKNWWHKCPEFRLSLKNWKIIPGRSENPTLVGQHLKCAAFDGSWIPIVKLCFIKRPNLVLNYMFQFFRHVRHRSETIIVRLRDCDWRQHPHSRIHRPTNQRSLHQDPIKHEIQAHCSKWTTSESWIYIIPWRLGGDYRIISAPVSNF